ncbi:MAG: bifunctional 2-polyprenyl-6-hydroxyphenol methylase/3-demethylubiquinol 3-O-methyltransferase UbiG [Planctomycetota bacterium]
MLVRNDLTIYDRHADAWWDATSPEFSSLHAVHRFRLVQLDEWVGPRLEGREILDLGCGGGLLSEAIAERGGRVTGVDQSHPSLETATRHAAESGHANRYVRADVRQLPFGDRSFDGVLLADVLEHVAPAHSCMAEAARVLKPGGWLYVNTINRTLRAKIVVERLAERWGYIPRGTHNADLFVAPVELKAMARRGGLQLRKLQGETPQWRRLLRRREIELRPARSLAIAYSALFEKTTPD